MYEAFDAFMRVSTWASGHPLDEKRFYQALSKIVGDDDFSAEAMGDYLRSKTTLDDEGIRERAVSDLVDKADVVREYFRANGGSDGSGI